MLISALFVLSGFQVANAVPAAPHQSHARLTFVHKNVQGCKEYRNEVDGSILIEIPTGNFTMGSAAGENDEKPVHTVYLKKYYIGKYVVTNRQYKRFCDVTGRSSDDPKFPGISDYITNYPDDPAVMINWQDAQGYCDWAGLQLPTEAEWEKAARGTGQRMYPWGDTWDSTRCNAFSAGDTFEFTSPVGSFADGASPYGAMDMAGNVWNWCSDWYDSTYYAHSPKRNPPGPAAGAARILRGGSWASGSWYCRTTFRDWYNPATRHTHYGFRVAFDRR